LAVDMLPRMPAGGNLGFHQQAAAGRESRLGRDHERGLVILPRARPFEIFAARDARPLVHRLVVFLRLIQPRLIEVAHLSSGIAFESLKIIRWPQSCQMRAEFQVSSFWFQVPISVRET